jgi:methyl-accepting chemotaxis protein
MSFLKLTTVRQKMVLITATLILPAVVLMYLLWSAQNDAVAALKQEQAGQQYLAGFRSLVEHLDQHRALAAVVLAKGDASSRAKLSAKTADVAKDIRNLDEIDRRLGSVLSRQAQWGTLKSEWEELAKRLGSLTPADSFSRHTQVLAEAIDQAGGVADETGLVVDADRGGYFAQDALRGLIGAAEAVGQTGALAAEVASAKQPTPEQRRQLQEATGRARALIEAVDADVRGLARSKPDAAKQPSRLVSEFVESAKLYFDQLNNKVLKPEAVEADPQALATTATAVAGKGFAFYDGTDPVLAASLENRIAAAGSRTMTAFIVVVVGLALAVLAVFAVSRTLTGQTAAIADTLATIGMGDFEARVPVVAEDELGSIAVTLNSLLDNTLSLIQSQEERDRIATSVRSLQDQVAAIAAGDLTVAVDSDHEITGPIAESINDMVAQLRAIVGNVQDATLQVSASANQIQATTEYLTRGSEAQATQIVETSAAVDEISVSIQQVADNTAQSLAVAEQARERAKAGAASVRDTIAGMDRIRDRVQETAKRIKRLGESSQSIGEIVQLIGDIADRTSILALNASIQAAMAGDAGLGFAVVAEEVERLAERSNDATKQIAALIKTIQSETAEAVAAMEDSTKEVVQGSKVALQAGQALTEIDATSVRLADIIKAITFSAKQQARGSEAISKSMSEISEVTQQTSEGTKQAAESVSELARLADELRGSVSTFVLPEAEAAGHGHANGHGHGHGNGNGLTPPLSRLVSHR